MTATAPSVLIDENIPRQLAPLLAAAGISVVDAARTAAGFSDGFLLDWASRENWMLVTADLDFPRLIFAERRHPPLVLVVERRQPCDPAQLFEDVMRIIKVGGRLHGHIVVFDGGDERVRAFPKGSA